MAYNTHRDVTNFWDLIGSSWNQIETTGTVENYWSTVGGAVDRLRLKVWELQLSRSLDFMPSMLDDVDNFYTIIYSGLSSNVVPAQGADLFEYPLQDDLVISIPSLVRFYQTTEDVYITGTYTENVDYTVSGYNTIVWKRTSGYPPVDPRYTNGSIMSLYAPHVYKINPVLMKTWGNFIGFNTSVLKSEKYAPFVSGVPTLAQKLEHIKYVIWALVSKKLQAPTLKILKDAFGIAHGLPFAYTSGIMSVAYDPYAGVYSSTIGNRTYVYPHGIYPTDPGPVNKFDVIATDLLLFDWVNGYNYVNAVSGHPYRTTKTLRLSTSQDVATLSSDADLKSTYIPGVTPVHFNTVGTIDLFTHTLTRAIDGTGDIRKTTTRTISGTSNLAVVSTPGIILGTARIQVTSAHTQVGRANIAITVTTGQIVGVARIQKAVAQTQLGKASIAITTTKTQTGKAQVRITSTKTQTGVARIDVVGQKVQTGVARITATTTKTQAGKASIVVTTTKTQAGVARIRATATATQTGKASIVTTTQKTQTGVADIYKTQSQTITGTANVAAGGFGNVPFGEGGFGEG